MFQWRTFSDQDRGRKEGDLGVGVGWRTISRLLVAPLVPPKPR